MAMVPLSFAVKTGENPTIDVASAGGAGPTEVSPVPNRRSATAPAAAAGRRPAHHLTAVQSLRFDRTEVT